MTAFAGAADEPPWVGDVLRFWFDDTPPEARFKRSDSLDATIARRYGALLDRLHGEPPAPATLTPRIALASVIVLDQFSRNIYRGEARAFESDPAALELAEHTVSAGLDRQLDNEQRLFLYLPFEHAENLALQDRAVELISALGDAELDRYAVAHRDIIRRFGRFPHRNVALGRPSTPEEIAFLDEPGSSF